MHNNNKIQDLPVFFILSRPRSGSTLLRFMLDAHPEIAIPPECTYIIDLYHKYNNKTKWDEKRKIKFIKDLQKSYKIESWFIDFDIYKEALINNNELNSYSKICKYTHLYYKTPYTKKDIKIIGDKNPIYSIYTNKLMKLFPGSKYIILTRDYRDNVTSIQKTDFEAPAIPLLAWRWSKVYNNLFNDCKKFPNNFISIKYEDLISNPEKTLKNICMFLNIEYHENMLNYADKKDEFYKLYDFKHIQQYFGNLFSDFSKDSLEKWKTNQCEKQIKVIESIAGDTGELAGYEKEYTQVKSTFKISHLIYFLYGALWYKMKKVYDLLPVCIKRYLFKPNFLAGFFSLFISKNKKKTT
ncbi:MAG: sulfotransferase [Marinilabiliales bacterium]